jgi:hypothetical protein
VIQYLHEDSYHVLNVIKSVLICVGHRFRVRPGRLRRRPSLPPAALTPSAPPDTALTGLLNRRLHPSMLPESRSLALCQPSLVDSTPRTRRGPCTTSMCIAMHDTEQSPQGAATVATGLFMNTNNKSNIEQISGVNLVCQQWRSYVVVYGCSHTHRNFKVLYRTVLLHCYSARPYTLLIRSSSANDDE